MRLDYILLIASTAWACVQDLHKERLAQSIRKQSDNIKTKLRVVEDRLAIVSEVLVSLTIEARKD